jgi:hypothetical protein
MKIGERKKEGRAGQLRRNSSLPTRFPLPLIAIVPFPSTASFLPPNVFRRHWNLCSKSCSWCRWREQVLDPAPTSNCHPMEMTLALGFAPLCSSSSTNASVATSTKAIGRCPVAVRVEQVGGGQPPPNRRHGPAVCGEACPHAHSIGIHFRLKHSVSAGRRRVAWECISLCRYHADDRPHTMEMDGGMDSVCVGWRGM